MQTKKKEEKISFRCASEEKKSITADAAEKGMKVGSYIVERLVNPGSVGKIPKWETAALCRMASLVSRYEDGCKKDEAIEELIEEVKSYVRSKSSR